jgi:predicted metalloprotease with PDZ domain
MKKTLIPGNGLLALAALFALGVGFVFAQDNPPNPQNPNQPPAAATPNASARTGAAVDAHGNAQANTNANAHANAQARRAGLGFKINAQGNQGLVIGGLNNNSAAARAGLRANDRIVSIDGRRFTSANQVRGYLAMQGGRQVPIVVDRGGQQTTIQLALDQRPNEGAWLGVNLDEQQTSGAAPNANVHGARIARVFPSGPAAQAGLQTGDVIAAINNQPINGAADVIATIQDMQPQTQIEVGIMRENSQMKVPVVLGDRSGYLGQFQQQYQQGQYQQGQYQQGQAQFAGSQRQGGQNVQVNRQSGNEDIPPYAMQLESERRNAEQHERIEDEIRQLREEVKKLRELLEKK